MLNRLFYIIIAVVVITFLGIFGFRWVIEEWASSFSGGSYKDGRIPDCKIHEENRISFHVKDKGFDLNRMLDSFKYSNSQYKIPDSSVMDHLTNCQCCCINDENEIFFNQSPREIYWINVERHTYDPGFEGQYNDDIGYIDIVSTYKNGDWHCFLTSKLDSAEKRRIRNRMKSEILPRLPMIKDTSFQENEVSK